MKIEIIYIKCFKINTYQNVNYYYVYCYFFSSLLVPGSLIILRDSTFLRVLFFPYPNWGPGLSFYGNILQYSGSSPRRLAHQLVAEMEWVRENQTACLHCQMGCQHFCSDVKANTVREHQPWSQIGLSSSPDSGI